MDRSHNLLPIKLLPLEYPASINEGAAFDVLISMEATSSGDSAFRVTLNGHPLSPYTAPGTVEGFYEVITGGAMTLQFLGSTLNGMYEYL